MIGQRYMTGKPHGRILWILIQSCTTELSGNSCWARVGVNSFNLSSFFASQIKLDGISDIQVEGFFTARDAQLLSCTVFIPDICFKISPRGYYANKPNANNLDS